MSREPGRRQAQTGASRSMTVAIFMTLVMISLASVANARTTDPCGGHKTSILIDGESNDLFLCKDGRSIENYSVAFGSKGLGKARPGDRKTPVGTFRLGKPRRSTSGYHKFIPIKIPKSMGSAVGIHGPKRWARWLGPFNVTTNWTAGCVAVWSDGAIEEISRFVQKHPRAMVKITHSEHTATNTLADKNTHLETGDLIFQTSKTKVAATVIGGTGSVLTHVGMIVMKRGQPMVIEAVGPVKYTPLNDFVRRGVSDFFTVRRIKGGLTQGQKRRLRRSAERYKGRPYDRKFRWDDKRIYCSELVYKAYMNGLKMSLNTPERIGDLYKSWNPFMKIYVSKVYGAQSPSKSEKIVTPERVYESKRLKTVIDTYPI